MRISTKGRYALRMLLDLAGHDNGEFISLKDIAERQNISKKYLEQIIPILNRAGFLTTVRGSHGGYKLTRTPDEYKVGDILRLTEGSLAPVPCLDCDPIGCDRKDDCATLSVWQGLHSAICDYLDNLTLRDILNSKTNPGDNYVI